MRRWFRRGPDAGTIVPRRTYPAVGRTSERGRSGGGRRSLSLRGTTTARLVGGTSMLVLTAALFWLVTDDAFRVGADGVQVDGIRYADEAAVVEHLSGLTRRPNVLRVRASELVRDLSQLPQVSSAAATVTLPANVTVSVVEREPLFQWSDGQRAWLVDASGVLFAPGELPPPDPDPDVAAEDAGSADAGPLTGLDGGPGGEGPDLEPGVDATAVAAIEASSTDAGERAPSGDLALLPVVEDARLVKEPPAVGSKLSDIDLAVMRQLLALTPELLGSRSNKLDLRIDQRDGYVLSSEDLGWQAVFGHYTPTLQPPAVVPRQVQCLSWLLQRRERRVHRVRLAVSDTVCGTFTRVRRSG